MYNLEMLCSTNMLVKAQVTRCQNKRDVHHPSLIFIGHFTGPGDLFVSCL